jgi:hypothetical protein
LTNFLKMKILKSVLFIVVVCSLFFCKNNAIPSKKIVENAKDLNYIPYFLKMYEADSLFLTNNFQKSYEILDALFKEYKPQDSQGFYEYGNYIASSVMSGHLEGIDEKIRYAYKNFGGVNISHKDFFDLKDSIFKKTTVNKEELNILKANYISHLNLELRKKIETMLEEDQSVRFKKDKDLEGMTFYQKKHKPELEKIFAEFGYPSERIIGSENDSEKSAEISIVLVHQKPEDKQKWLPILLENVKKGAIMPSIYSFIYDKMTWDFSEESDPRQYYGSFHKNFDTVEFSPPLINPKKTDSIRKSIGLFHTGYDIWRNKKINNNL